MHDLKLGGTAGYTMGAVARWTVITDEQNKTVAYVRTFDEARQIIVAVNTPVHMCPHCGQPNPERLQMDGCRDPECPEQA